MRSFGKTKKKRSPKKNRWVEIVVPPKPFRLPVEAGYKGPVFIWDLDKTYLRTEFESMPQLIRTAIQKARDKKTYPGATPLLKHLRIDSQGNKRPIYFVSASPPQMGEVIAEKFALDGVEIDGIYFKDNLRNIRPGRMHRLREQVGYKLLALSDLRQRLPIGAHEIMFGDDAESDFAVYPLYSQTLLGLLRGLNLYQTLRKQDVFRDDALRIAWRTRHWPTRSGVRRIFIHMHTRRDPRYYQRFSEHLVATRNFLQTVIALFEDRVVSLQAVLEVAGDLRSQGHHEGDLSRSLQELEKRRVVTTQTLAQCEGALNEHHLI